MKDIYEEQNDVSENVSKGWITSIIAKLSKGAAKQYQH